MAVQNISNLSTSQQIALGTLETVIDYIDQNSLIKTRPHLFESSIDTRALKERVVQEVCDMTHAGTLEETVIKLLTQIADEVGKIDNHTFFRETPRSESALSHPLRVPTAEIIDGIAILSLPACITRTDEDWGRYVTAGKAAVAECEAQGPRAWVIDLRLNEGGNMWPMLEVVAPLLGTEIPGKFDDPRSRYQTHPPRAWKAERPFTPAPRHYPVAVWTSRATASSGEITSIMFRGRAETRFIGDYTRGVPTSNECLFVANFGTLFLTTAQCQDRAGRSYIGEIAPEEYVQVPLPSDALPALSDEFRSLFGANTKKLLALTERWLQS